MRKKHLLLLCGTVILCFLSLLTAFLIDASITARDNRIQATATVYTPAAPTEAPPTTAPITMPPTSPTTAPPTVPGGTTPTTAPTAPTEPEYQIGPDFVIVDAENKGYSIQNFRGKPMILCFWGLNDANTVSELDLFHEFYKLYGQEAHFVMVHRSTAESKENAMAFLARKQYPFPVYFDTLGSAARAYKVDNLLTTYFLNAEGRLIARATGKLEPANLPKVLDAIGLHTTD